MVGAQKNGIATADGLVQRDPLSDNLRVGSIPAVSPMQAGGEMVDAQ